LNTNKVKKDILENMAHEFRTPLNAVLGLAELLMHEPLTERQMEYVNDIYASGQALLFIINDLDDENTQSELKKAKKQKLDASLAKVLVIDDNEFNLKVAKGFLKLSQIDADIAFSAKEGIELIKANDYNLVFMDYMMPEMDGIEAISLIRKLGSKFAGLKIIATTAKFGSSAKEMFLSNGFDDFMPKPLNITEIERVLKTWLPADKIIFEETTSKIETDNEINNDNNDTAFINALSEIKEIDTLLGLSRVEDDIFIYKATVEIFYNNLMSECIKMSELLAGHNIDLFGTNVHAMKSMLSTIGAMELSELALLLELAAKKGEADYCYDNYPPLHQNLLSLHQRLAGIFPN